MGLFNIGKKKNTTEKNSEPKEMKQYIPGAGGTIVSKHILNGERPLKWFFRLEGTPGNGWVAFGEGDDDAYVNNPDNMAVVDFNVLANIEPAVVDVFYMEPGADLEFRSDATHKYFVDTKTGQEIREPVENPVQAAFAKNLKWLNQEEYSVEWMHRHFQESDRMKPVIIGEVDCPSGEIAVGDPLCYLGDEKLAPVLNKKIPIGAHPVELSVLYSKLAGIRYAAARMLLSDKKTMRYEIAMPNGYSPKQLNEPGVFSFFGVDAGLACFCDVDVVREYVRFCKDFRSRNQNANLYDDYFQELFNKSYEEHPDIQRRGGDYIVWTIPGTNYRLPMFTSGLGDGVYSGYWGLDDEGSLTELLIPFINPEYF